VALLALLLNAAWVDSRSRLAAPRDGGKLIDTTIVPANVKVEGQGPALLLIHGFGAALDWWDEVAGPLAANHRVVRLDLIGHGGTAAPTSGYAIERQAQLAAAVLEKLSIDRVTVVGHSMGGEVAVALAELIPARIERLVLIDSPPVAGVDFTELTKLYLTPVFGEFLSHFRSDTALKAGLAQGFAPDFPVPEKFVADLRQLPYPAFRQAHWDSETYRREQALPARLSRVSPVPPLLVLFGTRDAIVPPEHAKFFESVPGAKIAMLDGVGHSPMVEAPQQTLELIEKFLTAPLPQLPAAKHEP
jgi:pimeloyl-ACP methyl ester carboxylesterase